ncbi:MAG: hypothetical protein V4542_18415 [Pseudomonadota bacterium]
MASEPKTARTKKLPVKAGPEPVATTTKKAPNKSVPNPISNATEKEWAAAWRTVIAPHEAFWRKHAKESAKPDLIAEQTKNGIKLVEELLAGLGQGTWPTLDDCIPKGSILEVVDKFFYEKTDLARELPFYTVLHYVTALMLQQGVYIKKSEMQNIYPDLWTLLLADTGGGKTMTLNAISNALEGKVKMFPDAKSYPKFFENLEQNNNSFYLKDEFAKFIRAINKDSKMEGLRGCLLEVYSNSKVSYGTMVGSPTVEIPAISILGLSQIENITEIPESMIKDGFTQRFGYSFARKDGRPRVLNYKFDGLASQVAPLWQKLTDTPFHPVYYLDDVVEETFTAGGNLVVDKADEVGVSEPFSRRIIFRAFKYALAYHVLTGKTDKFLHADDMAQGLRLCARELHGTMEFLNMFGLLKPKPSNKTQVSATPTSAASTTQSQNALPSSRIPPPMKSSKLALMQSTLQLRKNAGAPAISISKLMASVRAFRANAAETRALVAQVIADDPSLAPFVKV